MTAEEIQLKAERRARREARREKQRALNIVRAKQMHAARMALEAEQPDGAGSLSPRPTKSRNRRKLTAHIGCSGWYYWHWKFDFYKDLPSKEWFPHYAASFDTVELNAPFYAWPTVKTVETWVRQAARSPAFVYTVKVSELITHIKRFVGTRTLVRDFALIAELLGPRMGCFLYQLPPSYHYTPARLRSIAAQLEPLGHLRNVVEFRHKSWWNETVYRTFRETNLTFCSSSGPRMPDELVETNETLYVRFHGLTRWYRHDYTEAELQPWADRIRKAGARTLYAYFNNDREGHAIRNARLFRGMLGGQQAPAATT